MEAHRHKSLALMTNTTMAATTPAAVVLSTLSTAGFADIVDDFVIFHLPKKIFQMNETNSLKQIIQNVNSVIFIR